MLTFVPTPIGNLEDITLRALRALEGAEVVLCEDTRVAKKLFGLLEERFGLKRREKRFVSLHSHNEAAVLSRLDPALFESEVIYLSDAGMPAISDPGAALVRWCRQNGVDYTVLPGASAFVTAYAASGTLSTAFCFYGFLPHKSKARLQALKKLLASSTPVVLYEAPHRLRMLLDEIDSLAPDREIFAAKEISKRHECYFEGKASTLKERITGALEKGEWVIVLQAAPEFSGGDASLIEEILSLDLPPRQKAKRLAEATGRSVKECYAILTAENGPDLSKLI